MSYTPQKLYDVSEKSLLNWNKLKEQVINLLGNYTLRFKVLIDHAPRKFDCPKNQMAYRWWRQDKDILKLLISLKEIRNTIDNFITEIEKEVSIFEKEDTNVEG